MTRSPPVDLEQRNAKSTRKRGQGVMFNEMVTVNRLTLRDDRSATCGSLLIMLHRLSLPTRSGQS